MVSLNNTLHMPCTTIVHPSDESQASTAESWLEVFTCIASAWIKEQRENCSQRKRISQSFWVTSVLFQDLKSSHSEAQRVLRVEAPSLQGPGPWLPGTLVATGLVSLAPTLCAALSHWSQHLLHFPCPCLPRSPSFPHCLSLSLICGSCLLSVLGLLGGLLVWGPAQSKACLDQRGWPPWEWVETTLQISNSVKN